MISSKVTIPKACEGAGLICRLKKCNRGSRASGRSSLPLCVSLPNLLITSAMPRPSWLNALTETWDEKVRAMSWTDKLNATDWSRYADPRTIIPTVVLTGAALFSVRIYRHHLGRIPRVGSIEPKFYRKKSLFGRVTSVGDGDNFRLFHTPGGRLAGWGWLPGRGVPQGREDLKDETVG